MRLDPTRRLIAAAVVATVAYFVWLFFVVDRPIGWFFFILEAAIYLLLLLFIINHVERRIVLRGGKYSLRSPVDIFIATKGEPREVLQPTIKSAAAILHPNFKLYILDDSGRTWVRQLAEQFQATYISRPDRDLKPGKAHNLNYALKQTFGTFILVLDADQVVRPEILDDTLGHFSNSKVALVTTKQEFNVPLADFNNDYLFYEHMQAGKSTVGAAISTGSGVVYRRSALEKIGGMATWNMLEDLTTTFELNKRGYQSVYVSQAFTRGHAPQDLADIYKQRSGWAFDTLRLWIWRQPLFQRKLTWRQRLHYFELGYIYFASAIIVPSIYFLSVYSLFSNEPILNTGIWYLVIRLPSFYLTLHMYDRLGHNAASSRMWAALYPIFLWALIRAALFFKPRYKVTRKHGPVRASALMVFPQALTLGIGAFAIVYHLMFYGLDLLFTINVFWFGVMCYWFWPVFPRAFGRISDGETSLAQAS